LIDAASIEASARDLVTDVFRRQAADAGLSRAEALRQAMTALMDGPGNVEQHIGGRVLHTYAHPLFWAPYTIIGDGGAR
jgi:CHAT domain-containing protein